MEAEQRRDLDTKIQVARDAITGEDALGFDPEVD